MNPVNMVIERSAEQTALYIAKLTAELLKLGFTVIPTTRFNSMLRESVAPVRKKVLVHRTTA